MVMQVVLDRIMALLALADKDLVVLEVEMPVDKDQAVSLVETLAVKDLAVLEVEMLVGKDRAVSSAETRVVKDPAVLEVEMPVGKDQAVSLVEARAVKGLAVLEVEMPVDRDLVVLDLVMTMTVLTKEVISQPYPENQVQTIRYYQKFQKHHLLATKSYRDTMQTPKQDAKYSTYVLITLSMISYVPTVPYSINNILYVCGGISLIAQLLKVFMD